MKAAMDLRDMIKESIQEEENDAEKYVKMEMMALGKYPCKGYDAILRDIAREERVHKRHLESILADMPAVEEDEDEDDDEDDDEHVDTVVAVQE